MDEALYTRALNYLSRRPRSEKEVKDNLKKKKASDSQIEQILSTLRQQKFVNDYEFALWWIQQRRQFRPKGQRALEFELRQKGISEEVIKQLKHEDTNETSETENALVRLLIQKRIGKYEGMTKNETFQRLGGFLARRGFDLDIIKACIDEVFRK